MNLKYVRYKLDLLIYSCVSILARFISFCVNFFLYTLIVIVNKRFNLTLLVNDIQCSIP